MVFTELPTHISKDLDIFFRSGCPLFNKTIFNSMTKEDCWELIIWSWEYFLLHLRLPKEKPINQPRLV